MNEVVNHDEAGSSSQPKSKARTRHRSGTQSSSCTSQEDSNVSVYGDDYEEDEEVEDVDDEEPESSTSHDRTGVGSADYRTAANATPSRYDSDLNTAGLQLAFDFWRASDDPSMKKLSERELQELFSKAPDQLQRLHQQLIGNFDPSNFDQQPGSYLGLSGDQDNGETRRNGGQNNMATNYNNPLSQTNMFNQQFINNISHTLGPTLAAALSGGNIQPGQRNGVADSLNQLTGQQNQELLNTLAANPALVPFINYASVLNNPLQQFDPNTVALTNKFVQMAKEAHEAAASTSTFDHEDGRHRSVLLQTTPDCEYPPFSAFRIAQQHNPPMMFVDHGSQVAYFNFADLPSNKTTIQVEESKPEGTLRLVIQNFSNMADTVRGPSKIVQNVPWRIMIMPRQHIVQKKGTQKCLGFFLQCCPDAYSESWSCSAAAELRLISQKQAVPNFSRKTNHNYTSKENDWGYSCFMTWADILDEQQGYIHNDTVILEVHVKAEAAKNVMSLEDFRKKINGYIRLASLQCERGLIDKAIECNSMATKMCKDKDPECQRKLQSQNADLVARKLKQSIARIERGSDTAAETDATNNVAALRIAMTSSGTQRNSGIQKPRRKDTEKKRSKDESQDLASNGSINDTKSTDGTTRGLLDDFDEDDVSFCDNPEHDAKCNCHHTDKTERHGDLSLESLEHNHELNGEECEVLNQFDGKGTLEAFEELVANESTLTRRLIDVMFSTPKHKAALLAAVDRARNGVSTCVEEADKFSIPMRFELLSRSLICDGGFTFADIVEKESNALLKIIKEQAACAANPNLWLEEARKLVEDEKLHAIPNEPLFELTKSEMARLQKKICGEKDFSASSQQNAECQTDFPAVYRNTENGYSLPMYMRNQPFVQPFPNAMLHAMNLNDSFMQLNALKQQQASTPIMPRRTLTPRTKKNKGQDIVDQAGDAPLPAQNGPEKKENRKRKERPSSVQNEAKENVENLNFVTMAKLENGDLLNQPIANLLSAAGPIDNVEVIQNLVKQAYGVPDGSFDAASNEGLSRYAAKTMEALAKTGNMFAACLKHIQEGIKTNAELRNFNEYGRALEMLTKMCADNKLNNVPKFSLSDGPTQPGPEIHPFFQLAQDPEGERKYCAYIDGKLSFMFYPFRTGPSLIVIAKEVHTFIQRLQNRFNELQREMESVKKERNNLIKDKCNLQKGEKTLQEKVETLKQDNAKLNTQVKHLEKKVSNLHSDREDELQKHRSQVDHLKHEIAEKEAQHSRDVQSLNDVKKNYSKELSERQSQTQKLKDQLEEKNTLLKKFEAEKKTQRDFNNKLLERAKQAECANIELKTEHALAKLERAKADATSRAEEYEAKIVPNELTEEERTSLVVCVEAWKKTANECARLAEETSKECQRHLDMVKEGKLPSQLPKMNLHKPPPPPTVTPIVSARREPPPPPMNVITNPMMQGINKFTQSTPSSSQMNMAPHHNSSHAQQSAFRSMNSMNGPPPFGVPNPVGGPVGGPVQGPPFGNGSLQTQQMAPYMNQQRQPNMMFPPSNIPPIGSRHPPSQLHQQQPEPIFNRMEPRLDHFDPSAPGYNATRSCTPAEEAQLDRLRNVKSLWDKDISNSSGFGGSNHQRNGQIDPTLSIAQSVSQSAKYFPSANSFENTKQPVGTTANDIVPDLLRSAWGGDSIWSFNSQG
ncbi:unnamed protein product [Bursaphelenchus okinawaensis]|uniref:MATH domain-containing protein n=1 Tax=Bursaphelenchus okinawaensis TaxID=465554 RepID=A0A811KNA9_9BILA|nr:unnamed protein product [Bursaphelenchus okinawaensis]CAG9106679.1 unnamed protein product [Bursaphelenchus okinawaensis]